MARKQFVRGQRRLTTWFQFVPTDVTLATGATVVFTLNAAALALRPFTVVRSHFMVMIQSDQGAAAEDQVGAVGLAVVSDQAVTVGVTAIPTPITEMGSNLWFVHQLMMAKETNLVDRAQPAGIFAIDSKAMRKVEVGQDLVVVAEMSTAGSGIIITIGGRLLIKNN